MHVRAGRVVLNPNADVARAHSDDPAGCAAELVEAGAKRILIVNHDANRGIDDPRSRRALRAAVNVLRDSDVAVDIGGGIRSRASAEFWIESGAASAVLGTIAVYRPDIAGDICRAFPGRIMLGLDIKGDVAHSEGWIRDGGEATIHLRRWSPWPTAGVLRTNIAPGATFGESIQPLRRCIDAYPGPLLVNGGVHTIADVAQAAAAGAAAVVSDVADASGGLDLNEALTLFPGRDLVAPHTG